MAAALDSIDLLVRSPGIRLTHPLLVEAARRGIEVTTNVNLFLAEARGAGLPVIGITGSKGKSTTSTLTYRMLREAGRPAVLAGNIGTPVLDVLEEVLLDGIGHRPRAVELPVLGPDAGAERGGPPRRSSPST